MTQQNVNKMTRIALVAAIVLLVGIITPVFGAVTITNWTLDGYEMSVYDGDGTSSWTTPADVTEVDILLVAGGGGGGGSQGGGGGGGGVVEEYSLPVSGTVTVVVGAGGAGCAGATTGGHGGNSTFDATIAIGGGGGGTTGVSSSNGVAGGSGGGAAYNGAPGAGTAGEGYRGGYGVTTGVIGAGGGGGAGEVGYNGTTTRGGRGGDGVLSNMSGIWRRYGGGGGGGADTAALPSQPGDGGGGQGGWNALYTQSGTDGADGYGGGGGGSAAVNDGGDGGNGIVVVRWVGNVKSSFTANTTSGIAPTIVQFTDTSSGFPDTWYWEFGDGDTSTDQNPIHEYDDYGFYAVNLYAENSFSNDWENRTEYISVLDARVFSGAKYIVVEGSDEIVENYEIQLDLSDSNGVDTGNDIYCNGTVRSDWADIRFVADDINGNVKEVKYWIESCTTTSAKIWVNVPFIPASDSTNISFFYGNSSLDRSLSSGRSTFHAFDDFEDGTLRYWNTTEGYEWEIVTDEVKSGTYAARARNFLYQDNAGGALSKETDQYGNNFSNFTIDFAMRTTSGGSPTCAGFYMLTTFYDGGDIYGYQWRNTGYVSYNIGPTNLDEQAYPGSPQYNVDTWYNGSYTIDQVNASMFMKMNDVSYGPVPGNFYATMTNVSETSTTKIIPFPPTTFLYGAANYAWLDNFKVRSYRYPEPYADGTMDVPPPVAAFSANDTAGYNPMPVLFTDSSSDAVAWSWDFGDGNTSVSQNPTHTYECLGTFNVTLVVYNTYGEDTEEKIDYITVEEPPTPVAAFAANETVGVYNMPVLFTDASTNTPTSWYWNFGDGNTSVQQSPTHTYTYDGVFEVDLNATNAFGSDWENKTLYITVGIPGAAPVAAFTSNVTGGYAPFAVLFSDASINTPTAWNWYFPNGGDAHTEDATWTFDYNIGNTATSYDVSLNASNGDGFDWENKSAYITEYPLKAQFSANDTSGLYPLPVTFTDSTTNGTPTDWYWEFGDGNTSALQNPSHVYTYNGIFQVNLNASNVYSWDWENKTLYITVTAPTPTPTPTPTATPTSSGSGSGSGSSEWYLETCTNTTTKPATTIGADSVTLNGNVTSYDGDTVWFRWGNAPGTLPLATDGINVTSSPMNVSEFISGVPLFPGHKYYYRLCSDCGCSVNEENFTTIASSVTIAPIATEHYSEFINASVDDFNVTGMVDAGIGLYTENMGAMFWGLLLMFFFVGIYMRQDIPMIPFVLAIVGMTILAPILPPDWYVFVMGAAALILAGSIAYAIFGRRNVQ